jgi:hypothetical protein
MKWTHVLLVILLAAIMFGGTFTCFYSSGDINHATSHP